MTTSVLSTWEACLTLFLTSPSESASHLRVLQSLSPLLRSLLPTFPPPPPASGPLSVPSASHALLLLLTEAHLAHHYNYHLHARTPPPHSVLSIIPQILQRLYPSLPSFSLSTLPPHFPPLSSSLQLPLSRFVCISLQILALRFTLHLPQSPHLSRALLEPLYILHRLFLTLPSPPLPPALSPDLLHATLLAREGTISSAVPLLPASGSPTERYLRAAWGFVSNSLPVAHIKGLLDECVSEAYRTRDAMCLLARVDGGVEAWRLALAAGVNGRAAMWEAAWALGKKGWWSRMAGMLGKLAELDEEEESNEWIVVKGGRNLGRVDVTMAELRAWRGAREWEKVVQVWETAKKEGGMTDEAKMDAAWGLVSMGRGEEAVKTVSAIDGLQGKLVRAEWEMREGRVECAEKWLKEMGGEDCGAVWWHNWAVVGWCLERRDVDERFAAAEVKFGKEGKEGMESVFARCVVMMRYGRKEEAAGHWKEKRRGMEVEGQKEFKEEGWVRNGVDWKVVKKMDEICEEMYESARARRMVLAAMAEREAEYMKR